ncbi:MAG: C10 family peptidase [Bacteroidales bacterium]|nr:C10 family peptidase [Bacteroidales bacterium]
MRKKFIILQMVSLLIVFSAYAEPIDENTAKNVAKNFYYEIKPDSKNLTYNEVIPELAYVCTENVIPIYYIFNINQKDGFVIISADDDAYPVLGCSFTGEYFEGIEQPPNFLEWMNNYKDQILFIKKNSLKADEIIEQAWVDYNSYNPSVKDVLGVDPLLTTTWNQGCYYNELCPIDYAGPCDHVWAGCVATAMGQVMKYHNHPEQGTGSFSYNCPPYGTLSANFGETIYDWESMPNSISSNNDAIATLLYHLGVGVCMDYGPNGSGAGFSTIRSALIYYFSYSPSAQSKYKSSYTTSEWEGLLKDELDVDRPIIYVGFGSGGHAFVCDGYQGTNHFHFNWGWSGYNDGYFYVSNLNPGGSNFTEGQAAVFGVEPEIPAPNADFTSNITTVEVGGSVDFTDLSTGSITSQTWSFMAGTPFSSTQENPTIVYNTPGNHTVSLTVVGPGGGHTVTKENYITVTNIIPDPHFNFEGGDPSSPVWTIYLSNCEFEGEDLQQGDEVAIFDGEVMVGVFVLDQICSPENQFDNDMIAFNVLLSQSGYQPGNSYLFKCWDASQEIEGEYFEIELFNPYGDAYTGDVFPSGEDDYSVVDLDFSMAPEAHFQFEGGDPSSPVWTIYLGGGAIEGVDLVSGDEIAIFDGEVIVGTFVLDQILTMDNVFDNDLIAFSELFSQSGYQVGNAYSFKCWDASEELEIEYFEIELFNPYGDSFTGDVFPAGEDEYSIATLDFLSNSSQSFSLSNGFQFISSTVNPADPDMLVVMADVLNNLDFVRNSQGAMLRKIGPNWINGIGDWIVEEGYLVKMNADDSFSITGTFVDPTTPISVEIGYQFVSYFPENPMDALLAFETVISADLDFIRNTQGQVLRKIGSTWVNGIGDCQLGEGYLVKMFADGEIIYPASAKSSGKIMALPTHFVFEGGNAAEAVYTLYLEGLEIGDEVAAYNGEKLVGTVRINSQNAFENELPIFSTLTNGVGYEEGKRIILKVWSENNIVSADFNMEAVYDSYVSNVYPGNDGEFSVLNIKKGERLSGELVIYPNPATDIINISSTNQINNVVIFNYVGQSVYEGNSTQINSSKFKPGVYIIKIETIKGIETQKVTIK